MDADSISTLTDSNTVSPLESTDIVYITLKGIKHDSEFNSKDTPK